MLAGDLVGAWDRVDLNGMRLWPLSLPEPIGQLVDSSFRGGQFVIGSGLASPAESVVQVDQVVQRGAGEVEFPGGLGSDVPGGLGGAVAHAVRGKQFQQADEEAHLRRGPPGGFLGSHALPHGATDQPSEHDRFEDQPDGGDGDGQADHQGVDLPVGQQA